MSRLAPNLFDRRFDDLVAIGRSRLPALAPEWTDHNAHDPGITLMELLAWVAEAQIYALARTRRDERAAYAALLGVVPGGTTPAQGAIWPDHSDSASPASVFRSSIAIPVDAVVNPLNADKPTFRPLHRTLLVPGRIRSLRLHKADGGERELTSINARGGAVFLPFGESAGPRDVLFLEYECTDDAGLFPAGRPDIDGACLSIGVRADAAAATNTGSIEATQHTEARGLRISLVSDAGTYPLRVVADSSAGMLRTGVVALDLSQITGSPRRFALEFSSPRGFVRPPRLIGIQPNVLAITQERVIVDDTARATGLPDFAVDLAAPGIAFAPGKEPIEVYVDEGAGPIPWQRCARLSDEDPDATKFEFDAAWQRITFGNGLNGRRPSAGARIVATFRVCDGPDGNVARNHQWRVAGFEGAFGVNPDPVTGGQPASDSTSLRRSARQRARTDRPIVTRDDLVKAALDLPLLEVARAWVVSAAALLPRTGIVTLVAMRARPGGVEPGDIPETPRWLEAIRLQLTARMTLGTRLRVAAPRYVAFRVVAKLAASAGYDLATVRSDVQKALAQRMPLVDIPPAKARDPGAPVTRRDLMGWIRGVVGVDHVVELKIVLDDDSTADRVDVPRNGLPRYDPAQSDIEVELSAVGRTQ